MLLLGLVPVLELLGLNFFTIDGLEILVFDLVITFLGVCLFYPDGTRSLVVPVLSEFLAEVDFKSGNYFLLSRQVLVKLLLI